jgi:hypothetical protein
MLYDASYARHHYPTEVSTSAAPMTFYSLSRIAKK